MKFVRLASGTIVNVDQIIAIEEESKIDVERDAQGMIVSEREVRVITIHTAAGSTLDLYLTEREELVDIVTSLVNDA